MSEDHPERIARRDTSVTKRRSGYEYQAGSQGTGVTHATAEKWDPEYPISGRNQRSTLVNMGKHTFVTTTVDIFLPFIIHSSNFLKFCLDVRFQ